MNDVLSKLGIDHEQLIARGLSPYDEANSVELVETEADGREHYLVSEAAAAWREMKAAARADSEIIFIVSAYRSIDRQAEIIRGKLDQGQDIDEILTVCAPPGYSEHHTGRAVDLSTPEAEDLSEEFKNTTAYLWLCKNAHRFNFILSYPEDNALGYQHEPWHWCYCQK